MKCFNCDQPIIEFGPDDHCVNRAVLFEGSPGFGSCFDSTLLCEESLQIAVCDACMKIKFASINLVYQPRPILQIAGMRPWSPDYDCQEPAASRLNERLKDDPTHPDHPDYKEKP